MFYLLTVLEKIKTVSIKTLWFSFVCWFLMLVRDSLHFVDKTARRLINLCLIIYFFLKLKKQLKFKEKS